MSCKTKHIPQTLVTIILGPLIALTRFTEHYHHATDVLVGIILGYISFFCLLALERWFLVEPCRQDGYSDPANPENGDNVATNNYEIPDGANNNVVSNL